MMNIRELLQTRPLLFDGAMGTYYKAAPGVECEQANLTDPAGVLAVHREYLAAGADAVKTNTFSLPRLAAAHTPGWEQLAQAGWQLAVQAAEETGAAVFADLGPAPDTEAVPAGQVYTAVAKQFAALGARNFLFETLSSDAGLLDAVGAIKAEVPDAFVLVSFAVLPDGYTREGMYCKDLARRMQESGIVDAVGLNCVSAPGAMRTLAKQLGGTLPLLVMPNAGYPVVTRTQVKYQGRPEYFARELGRLAAEGTVQILGGCCGTTPAHIAALRAELDSLPVVEKTAPAEEFSTVKEQTVENEDSFLRKLNAGEKVIAIELDSPRNADLTGYLEGAKKLQAAGADLLTIADCPIAQARMDSSLVACRVHRELGLCTLPHMTCRDRNLNATKALLLGLYAEGVREVLAITGDPIPTAERDEVKNVYQFNSRKLAQYIVSLAGEGREMPGPMTVFGALNLNARNFDVELRRAKEKLENGMSGFLTQPVLSAQAVENLKKSRETLGADAKILAGIMPVVSQRNAIFMENEINGIHVEDWIIEKFAGLDRAQGEELGLAISLEMAKAALPYADGLYLMTPFNRVALMERLIGRLKQEVLGAY
ncbi:bifunctional homocysteine S-methyltransferase/methylenetetrahydrofolate reductase [Faecalibacterium prausnitzii]|uniref:Bifunctional homocysteine S-methyltransferase/methylenetetrahydrofolate reductase n=1 Tax=Faecalibacterium prausnitzii TaxID=853 RepID=A0A844DTF5_9FIRM|nr:bifunctional homocysteine S-methyltransferase/methylenetetrahydrofolate reductase [Faecalibacterium prausnitzii]MSC64147.1 bifunctional homocysteine S-methyltransferase/methylenetetrahydrofolate reductase [Faecalibacterium prausnitzii]